MSGLKSRFKNLIFKCSLMAIDADLGKILTISQVMLSDTARGAEWLERVRGWVVNTGRQFS